MTNVQLIADPQYLTFFSDYLKKHDTIMLDGEPDVVFDASFLNPAEKAERLSKLDTNALIISNTLTMSTAAARAAAGTNARVCGMPMLPYYFDRQKTVEYAFPFGVQANDEDAKNFLALLGKSGEKINDAVAGIFPRALAMIINEAAFAVQESVATAKDIDTAMKLGTNYPKGPLAWCDEIGATAIVAVLDALATEYGSDRYRVASLLRRNAEGGLKFIED